MIGQVQSRHSARPQDLSPGSYPFVYQVICGEALPLLCADRWISEALLECVMRLTAVLVELAPGFLLTLSRLSHYEMEVMQRWSYRHTQYVVIL